MEEMYTFVPVEDNKTTVKSSADSANCEVLVEDKKADADQVIKETKGKVCPNCGFVSNGNFCSNCGFLLDD